jgi:hypothetical protein
MSTFEGYHSIVIMDWFVKKVWAMLEGIVDPADKGDKGHKLREDEHSSVEYYRHQPVTDGGLNDIQVSLYSFDSKRDRPPPMYEERGRRPRTLVTMSVASFILTKSI